MRKIWSPQRRHGRTKGHRFESGRTGGNVGKPGDAIRQVLEENNGKASMIIMVDAALKLEGEKTGEISEGIGAAIGGIGTERFKIEEEATKFGIPVYAIVIKQSIQEAVTTMKKEIAEAAEPVIEKIKRLIPEHQRRRTDHGCGHWQYCRNRTSRR